LLVAIKDGDGIGKAILICRFMVEGPGFRRGVEIHALLQGCPPDQCFGNPITMVRILIASIQPGQMTFRQLAVEYSTKGS
jgi:hypothetical protein